MMTSNNVWLYMLNENDFQNYFELLCGFRCHQMDLSWSSWTPLDVAKICTHLILYNQWGTVNLLISHIILLYKPQGPAMTELLPHSNTANCWWAFSHDVFFLVIFFSFFVLVGRNIILKYILTVNEYDTISMDAGCHNDVHSSPKETQV